MRKLKAGFSAPDIIIFATPVVYSFLFYIYLFVLTNNIRTLKNSEILIGFGLIALVAALLTRVKRFHGRMVVPEERRGLLLKYSHFNKFINVLVVIAGVALILKRDNIFILPFFAFYILLLAGRIKFPEGTDAPEMASGRANSAAPVLFYAGVIFLYALLAVKITSLRETEFIAPPAILALLMLASHSSFYLPSEKDSRFRAKLRRFLAAANLAAVFLFVVAVYLNISFSQALRKDMFWKGLLVSAILFIPIYLLEEITTVIVNRYSKKGNRPSAEPGAPAKIIKIGALFVFFNIWVMYSTDPPTSYMAWMQAQINYAFKAMSLFPAARPGVAVAAGAAILALYAVFWMRFRRGRIVFSIAAPIILMVACYVFFYWNIWSRETYKDIINQPGVELISTPAPDDEKITLNHSARFPRALRIDPVGKKIFVSFGSIYGNPQDTPSLISTNLDGSGMKTLILNQKGKVLIRDFQLEDNSKDIFFCTWGYNYILYRLDRETLAITKKYSFKNLERQFRMYDAYDLIPQEKRNRAFLLTGQPPALVRFNLGRENTAGFEDVLDLSRTHVTEFGSILHQAVYDDARNLIYAVAVTGDHNGMLLEFDAENMKLLREVSFPEIVISLKMDPETDEILMGCGLEKRMIAVDRKSFNVKARYDLPVSTIRNFIIDRERNKVYIVDHLGGRVFIMDRGFKRILKALRVGNKPIGMDKYGQYLYVASTLGIVKIDLNI
jgi:hypothetical protein